MENQNSNNEDSGVRALDFSSTKKPFNPSELIVGYDKPLTDPTKPVEIAVTPSAPSLNDFAEYARTHYIKGKKKGQLKPLKSGSNSQVNTGPINQVNPVTQNPGTVRAQLISGALFITLVDLIIPTIIAAVNNKVSKDKIKVKDLQLLAEQRKSLEPLADEMIKQLNIVGDPKIIMVVTLVGMYGMNFMLLKAMNSATK